LGSMSVSRSMGSSNILMSRSIQAKEDADAKSKKLILTLTTDDKVPREHIEYFLKKRFEKFSYNVEISPIIWKPGSYVVVFEDEKLAEEALSQAEAIGYNLAKYRGRKPSPKCLVKYKALADLWIRTGKSMQQRRTERIIRKNEIVTVNQVKGRRARIVSIVNGEQKNIGWVSLHTLNGESLMKRVDD